MNDQTLPLVIEVVKVHGHCPVHRVGDCFAIRKGRLLDSDLPVCMHALQALSPYFVPLSRGLAPLQLGLAGPHGAAYLQCQDPSCASGGSSLTMRITNDEKRLDQRLPFEGRLPVRF